MSPFVEGVATLLTLAVCLTTIDARAYDNGPTGIFYHRIVAFPFGNEVTEKRWQKIDNNEAQDLCASVGKELPYMHSQREIEDLIAELNAMHAYGNLLYCNPTKLAHRRFWIANKMKTKGQIRFNEFSHLDDNGEYCASLYWREDDDIGYRLNGQPCHRRCNTICLRNKYVGELHMEHFHFIGGNHGWMRSYTGRHNYTGTQNKCAHYGKDLVTVSSTQDMLDLQEEIHRMGIYVQDEHRGLFEHRNFYLKSDGVGGEEYSPLRVEDAVAGSNCLVMGQEHSSHVLGYMNTWSGPCTVPLITLCTDDEPGRFYGRITLEYTPNKNKADAEAFCASIGKVLPDVQTDEDVMDLGREIIRIQPEDRILQTGEFWTPLMTDYDTLTRMYVEDITPGPYCMAISNWAWAIKEIWSLHARACTDPLHVACMDP